jgi:hypothetical protein
MGGKSSWPAPAQAPEVPHEKAFGIKIGNQVPSPFFVRRSAKGARRFENVVFDLRSRNMFQIEIPYRFWPLHKAMPPVSTASICPSLSSSRNQKRESRTTANSLAQGFRLIKDENDAS